MFPSCQDMAVTFHVPKPLDDKWNVYGHFLKNIPRDIFIPVVPGKAVAEVSQIGHYRRGELLWCMDGRAIPLMDRKVIGVVFFGVAAMFAVVTSPTTASSCSVVEL